MIVKITAHANNKRNVVERDMFDEIHVYTNVRPKDGEANKEIIKMLADYFDTSKSSVKILKGHNGRIKTFEINI